jgi:hypothetical protein
MKAAVREEQAKRQGTCFVRTIAIGTINVVGLLRGGSHGRIISNSLVRSI